MAVLPIVRIGDPVLRTPTRLVTEFDGVLQTLIEDMIETMYDAPGVGLAANQVGVSLRLMVMDLTVGEKPGNVHVCINPRIVHREGAQQESEGCLSVPDFMEAVTRPDRVVMSYLDRDGYEREMEGRELMARAICHECDHLDGHLYIDHVTGLRKDRLLRRIRRVARSGW